MFPRGYLEDTFQECLTSAGSTIELTCLFSFAKILKNRVATLSRFSKNILKKSLLHFKKHISISITWGPRTQDENNSTLENFIY